MSTLNNGIKNLPPQVDVGVVLGQFKNDSNGNIVEGTALSAVYVHEVKGNVTLEQHKEWEQKLLDYLLGLDVRIQIFFVQLTL